eukprot:CAMPEP_0206158964 /NCGR_PEP_ID=MMETSP1474-20131121/5337_1 /ASSEMBLY_ACC=CAM_ASM_001110 /TAXON_ID=97495 /ORGANISM="Imantonia sp., Strain RCC918" /LENGTH=172 /DNA_ID=CAMNT_0053559339 /DNA_START=32 /DNA_END=550 /DNA_ORIENTATION=+
MFPWMAENTENSASNVSTDPIRMQIQERAQAKALAKQQRIAAERADDARVEREQATFRAEAERELQVQRDREALVARREAMAAQRYEAAQKFTATREQQVEAYQRRLEEQDSYQLKAQDQQAQAELARTPRGDSAATDRNAGRQLAPAHQPDGYAQGVAATNRARMMGSSIF